jgi:hypothetical protein
MKDKIGNAPLERDRLGGKMSGIVAGAERRVMRSDASVGNVR